MIKFDGYLVQRRGLPKPKERLASPIRSYWYKLEDIKAISLLRSIIFYRELQRQIEKEQLQEEAEKNERLKNADFVRAQIIDKETLKLAERKAFFQEGIKMEEEARMRKARLEEVTVLFIFSDGAAIASSLNS